MVAISCIVAADNGPVQYLSHVNLSWWNLQKEDQYTDVVLVSGQIQVRVHREILLRVSSFLHDLVPPSCSCETPAITLPRIREDTLKALVELAYTGRSKIESRKAKEEFEELSKVLQIGLDIEYQEIVSQEREDQVTPANQVVSVIVKMAGGKVTAAPEIAAHQRKKSEEKAAAERRKDEQISSKERKKYVEMTAAEKKEAEGKAAFENKKAEGYVATGREKYEGQADGERSKLEQRAASDEEKKNAKDAVAAISFEEKKKKDETDKTTTLKDSVATVETEFITALGLNRLVYKKTTAPNQKEENKTFTGKKIKKASPVKVGGSVRLTRSRRKKSTVQETQAIPFLSPISQRNRVDSPDSIHAKTTRSQKRKIQTVLNVSDEIDVISEPKRKRLDLIIQPTEESSRFVNIQDITADSNADADMLDENYVKENNNNELVQDPIEVNAPNDSIEDPLQKVDISIFSDEGVNLSKRKKFVCLFCDKEFQKKPRYDYHLSCHHFQSEISEKFPGMECTVCKKTFHKKSNYISHMGSFHKIIDGFMKIAQIREDKMALIREDKIAQIREDKMVQIRADQMARIREMKQHKPFAWPQAERQNNSWMESLRRKNTSTPNEKRLPSRKEQNEILDTPTSCSASVKERTEDEEAEGNHNKVETIEDIQAFINELPKSKL